MTAKQLDTFMTHYIQSWDEYSDLKQLFDGISATMQMAREAGWEGISVKFCSTLEPYDQIAGPVEVIVQGLREATEEEKACLTLEKELQALAKKLDISVFEASVVRKLQRKGVIKE